MQFRNAIGYVLSAVLACGTLAASIVPAEADSPAEESKLIALTFDDGPNTTTTNEILDILEQYDAKASFFLIGNNINAESAVSVKRAYDMGCEINNHSRTHSNMPNMTEEEMLAEIEYVDNYVYEITGEYTKFFRPPFIDTNQTMYEVIDKPFICGFGCYDYMENVTAQERADAVISAAEDGLIVLLHDAAGNDQTVEALETIIPTLLEDGYEFVTLTELFERQGETPKRNMLYNIVAKYPCSDYTEYQNLFTGETAGDGSWTGWSEITTLDKEVLSQLGGTYAIQTDYTGEYPPVVVLQRWSGESLWYTIQPSYYNGERACFLAEDILSALALNGVDYTDLDRMSIMPYSGTMTLTSLDLLVKNNAAGERAAGDVNSDGDFSIADIIMLQKYLLGSSSLTDWDAGDLCEDSAVNAYDLSVMKRMLLTK